jgi:hypothetical protein
LAGYERYAPYCCYDHQERGRMAANLAYVRSLRVPLPQSGEGG